MRHQNERSQHLVPIGAGPRDPLAHMVDALVAQRFRLFDAVGNAAPGPQSPVGWWPFSGPPAETTMSRGVRDLLWGR